MQPDALTVGQRAALRRLQRAQLAEGRRIRQAVAVGYTLTPAQLTSPCRVADLAEARQVAMWLMRTRLTWPLPTRDRAFPCDRIGRVLGGRARRGRGPDPPAPRRRRHCGAAGQRPAGGRLPASHGPRPRRDARRHV